MSIDYVLIKHKKKQIGVPRVFLRFSHLTVIDTFTNWCEKQKTFNEWQVWWQKYLRKALLNQIPTLYNRAEQKNNSIRTPNLNTRRSHRVQLLSAGCNLFRGFSTITNDLVCDSVPMTASGSWRDWNPIWCCSARNPRFKVCFYVCGPRYVSAHSA